MDGYFRYYVVRLQQKISEKAAAGIGIKGFAYKPVTNPDLARTVRKVLDGEE